MSRLLPVACLALTSAFAAVAQDDGAVTPEPAEFAVLAADVLLLDAEVIDGHAVAVGARGHILRIEPDLTWTQMPAPVNRQLTAVDFVDEARGWAVGHDAAILATTDGGASWTLQHFDPEREQPLFNVHFMDAERGLAVGAYGLMLATDDGGESWFDVEYSEDEFADSHLNAIAQHGDTLVVVGERGSVYRSPDLGETWEEADFPYDGSMFGVVVTDGGRFVAFGLRGHVLASDDDGRSWQEVVQAPVTLNGGTVLSDGRIVLVGLNGVVMVSADGGRTFLSRRDPIGDALADAFRFGDGPLIVIGAEGFREYPIDG